MKTGKIKFILAAAVLSVTAGIFGGCGAASQTELPPVQMEIETPADLPDGALTPEEIRPNPPKPPEPSEPWIPDILDRDDGFVFPDETDDSVKYAYDDLSFGNVSGSFSVSSEQSVKAYLAASDNSMAVCDSEEAPFRYGTISCALKPKTNTDSGLVFGLSGNQSSYWEGPGIRYYFFFLSRDGTAYLGKTADGVWSMLQTVPYVFNDTDTYTLKIVYKNGKICGYVNQELLIACRDNTPLTGTGFGMRSGAAGVKFSELNVTSEYLY